METAPFKLRVYAFLLDYLLIAMYGIFIVGSISFLFQSFIDPLFSGSPVIAELTGFLLLTLPVVLYFIISEQSKWQGTWGKKKMGLLVVNETGQRISLGRSVIRSFIKFLPWEMAHFGIWRLMLPTNFSETTLFIILNAVNLCILAFLIVPLTNKKRKNIYDWGAGTFVARAPR
ncbi:RDD family protein [Halobacillus sp. Marseille-Q1614]|uniref:RDD family protein n=1 Tax=Halobacillus sp. Marseille-Q1614 TaxID=2709134 RepID=UPI001570B284|nr:RDD family protein [Halobacillus sp. Marseille-Q1614]